MNESLHLLVPLKEFSEFISSCYLSLNEIVELFLWCVSILLSLSIALYFLIHHYRDGKSKFRLFRHTKLPGNVSRVLLVTAHPDDESMFFGPTLIALKKRKCRIFVLCMSKGDYDKLGHFRKNELWDSCKIFEINSEDITLMNCTQLQDDPNHDWKVEVLSTIILKHVETLDIDLLITFDKDGISQHKNHQAIYYATASLCLSGLVPLSCRILILETVNIIRKYISIFDVLITLLLSTNWTILKWHERKIVHSAMYAHRSQMVWFRWLFITFSRYMLINSLMELNVESIEFDILES